VVLGELRDLPPPALALVALFALERFVELAISRARLAAAAARGSQLPHRTAGGPLHWTAMVALHALLLVLPPVEALALGTRAPGWLLVASIAAALGGASAALLVHRLARPGLERARMGRSGVPHRRARAIPLDPPSELPGGARRVRGAAGRVRSLAGRGSSSTSFTRP
jgi:hypothetical protein